MTMYDSTRGTPLVASRVSTYLTAYAGHLRKYGYVTAWIGIPTREQAENVLLDLAAELGVEPEKLSIEYFGSDHSSSSVVYRLAK